MGKNRDTPEGLDDAGEEPLMSSHYEYTDRPVNDKTWAVAYAVVLALSVVGGVYATTHRNHEFGILFDTQKMSNPGTCPAPTPGRRLLAEQNSVGFPDFFRSYAFALVGTALASLASGVVFLYTFRHQPLLMVKLTIASQIALPAALGLYLLSQGATFPGIMMLVMAGVAAFAFTLWRDFIPLCARLLSVAAQGLNENQGLIGFAILANIALAFLIVPLVGLSGLAFSNGQLVPNPERQLRGGQCQNAQGQQVPCCMWQADSWAGAFIALNSVTLLWTMFLVGEIRVFVTSGTIAQWYFAQQGSSTQGNTLRSVKHAMGPSFGSLCFGSAILTLVQLIRNAMESVRQQYSSNGDQDVGQMVVGILLSIMSCILEGFLQLVEFLTKFATVRLAITGEHFMLAAHSATDLLARNFLKTYGVWFFPPMVLQLGAFVIAAVWGVLVFSLSWLGWHSHESGTKEAAALGLLAGFIAWAVNAFFAGVLLSVVDAVYFCYALDRDNQAVTKPEVHEVYSEVPVSKGIAVEQPGGDLAYGNPGQQQGQQQQQHSNYVPPSDTQAASNAPQASHRV